MSDADLPPTSPAVPAPPGIVRLGRAHVCFVVDASGSMEGVVRQVVDGVNRQVAALRESTSAEPRVSVVLFHDVTWTAL